MLVLALNAGSSSLKFAAFRGDTRVAVGKIDRIGATGGKKPHLHVEGQPGRDIVDRDLPSATHPDAVKLALDAIRERIPEPPEAVGHRVVHGGDEFTVPVAVTPEVMAKLEDLVPLAPLHQPHNLAAMKTVGELLPGVPQVACFDTAFHATMPAEERTFAIPRRFRDVGVKRYGFHGLAYESVLANLKSPPGKLLACHLGNGASLCGIVDGRSVATTMGFTPLDGLVMGTRPGHLDPGAVLYLERQLGLSPDEVDRILERESGLLAASDGISADMRDLIASPEPAAAFAVSLFCYRIVRDAGAMIAAMGGLDAIAFSGGIGENSPEARAAVCDRLAWLGAKLDPAANAANRDELHATGSRVAIRRVAVDEEAVIASLARRVSGGDRR